MIELGWIHHWWRRPSADRSSPAMFAIPEAFADCVELLRSRSCSAEEACERLLVRSRQAVVEGHGPLGNRLFTAAYRVRDGEWAEALAVLRGGIHA